MPSITTAGETVREYCHKWPQLADMTLAKKIYKDHRILFTSLEQARTKVRYFRGHKGNHSREKAKDKELFKPLTFDTAPKLPESRTVAVNKFVLPTSIKKVLLIGDTHFPYHDTQAIEAAVMDGVNENVDCVFCNGDILDFYQLSFHEKDPRKTSIPEELEMGKQFFAYLRHHFPKAVIYFCPGNHEIRLERYLKIKAPELLDVDEFRLDMLMHLRDYDVQFVQYSSKVYFGKLLVEHGDKLKGNGGVSPARTIAAKFKRHTITGHFHRTNEYLSKVYDGDTFVTYSVACLCDLEPAFFPVNEHGHGHAIIEMLGEGEFRVKNKKIVNGKVY